MKIAQMFLGRRYEIRFLLLAAGSLIPSVTSTTASAQEYWPRHYPPYNAANPRPDLLPRGLYDAWVPYRAKYNRPTYLGGLIAHTIEPSSQEAVSWEENVALGYYKTHCPTPIRNYYHPKPWEVLETGARPAGNQEDEFRPDIAPAELTPTNPSPAIQRF